MLALIFIVTNTPVRFEGNASSGPEITPTHTIVDGGMLDIIVPIMINGDGIRLMLYHAPGNK